MQINAMNDYESGMTYKAIAEKYGVSPSTISSWQQRYNWVRKKEKKQKAPKRKRGAPKGNKNHLIHGIYSKLLPKETLKIVKSMDTINPLDIIWANIEIAYSTILRAQQIMYVKDKDDISVTKVGESTGKIESEKWEVQYAWDKQASFMKAQAIAQNRLSQLIKQYDEMLHKNWDLATEEQQARIAVLKAKIEVNDDEAIEDDGFIDALKEQVNDIWQE